MTTRRTLDKALAEPTYRRIIERGPWTHYARRDECGVDAGLACRDEHDHVVLEVCDGLVLVIDDSVARCRPDAPPSRLDRSGAEATIGSCPPPKNYRSCGRTSRNDP